METRKHRPYLNCSLLESDASSLGCTVIIPCSLRVLSKIEVNTVALLTNSFPKKEEKTITGDAFGETSTISTPCTILKKGPQVPTVHPMDSGNGCLLALILETNPTTWPRSLKFSEALQHICVFINAHLSIKRANTVAVFAAHATSRYMAQLTANSTSRIIYPSKELLPRGEDTGKWQFLQEMNDQLVHELKNLFDKGTKIRRMVSLLRM